MTNPDTTQTKLRFRIKLLLAERDMTVANLYQLVKQQGFDISSSHFFRQMTPYPNAVRPDLLAKRKAEDKRKSALLGPKVAVLGLKKDQ